MADKLDSALVELLARKISGLSATDWKNIPRAQHVVYQQAGRRALRAIASYNDAKKRVAARKAASGKKRP